MLVRHSTLIDRFVLKTRKSPNGCILWTAARNRVTGYGIVGLGGRDAGVNCAHRVSWELFIGPIPDGLQVLHNCPGGDNRACVNPKHLWLGTQADNVADANRKGRLSRGKHRWNVKLSEEKARDILRRARAGEPSKVIAADFLISYHTVDDIKARRTWKQLDWFDDKTGTLALV